MQDRDGRHGNRLEVRKPKPPIDVRKVPADSVPYGDSISRNGKFVWVVVVDNKIVCVAATATEVRRKYRDRQAQ